MRKRLLVPLGAAAAVPLLLTAVSPAQAVSDGNYRWQNQHCSPWANAFDPGPRGGGDHTSQVGCHTMALTVADNGGHEYFGIGFQQTPDHEQGTLYPVAKNVPDGVFSNVHQEDVWYDLGSQYGGCHRYVFDSNNPTNPPQPSPTTPSCPWMNPNAPNYFPTFDAAPDPTTGIRIYLGADDNLAGGEHDSAYALQDGPSDGGATHLALDPRSLAPWLLAFAYGNPQYVLTHPLPAGDAGIGFCADGICLSVQTQRQVAYQGGDNPSPDPGRSNPDAYPGGYPYAAGTNHDDTASRDVAQYNDHTYDKPMRCDSDGDHPKYCGAGGMGYWHNQHSTVYDEPGVQIYNDPDPDGDSGDGIYPHPGIYIGTCGVIIGGKARPGSNSNTGQGNAPWTMPPSPWTTSQGQLVLATGCSTGTPGSYGATTRRSVRSGTGVVAAATPGPAASTGANSSTSSATQPRTAGAVKRLDTTATGASGVPITGTRIVAGLLSGLGVILGGLPLMGRPRRRHLPDD